MKQIKNCTTMFLMPVFGVRLQQLESIGFIDAFIADKDRPNSYGDGTTPIYALFRPGFTGFDVPKSPMENSLEMVGIDKKGATFSKERKYSNEKQKEIFRKVLKVWEEFGTLLDEYDYENGYVVVVLNFPAKFKKDYQLFLEGKYSKFSNDYKDRMPKKITVELEGRQIVGDSTQHMVIYKDQRMRKYWEKELGVFIEDDMEFWGAPNMERETLDIDLFSQTKGIEGPKEKCDDCDDDYNKAIGDLF